MTFKTRAAGDLAAFFNAGEFAEAVVYNNGTSSATVSGVVDYGGVSGAQASGATLHVMASEVPAPAYGHTFTISGQVWSVRSDKNGPAVKGDGSVFEIGLIRDQRSTKWRT